jgi:hypothetical protein
LKTNFVEFEPQKASKSKTKSEEASMLSAHIIQLLNASNGSLDSLEFVQDNAKKPSDELINENRRRQGITTLHNSCNFLLESSNGRECRWDRLVNHGSASSLNGSFNNPIPLSDQTNATWDRQTSDPTILTPPLRFASPKKKGEYVNRPSLLSSARQTSEPNLMRVPQRLSSPTPNNAFYNSRVHMVSPVDPSRDFLDDMISPEEATPLKEGPRRGNPLSKLLDKREMALPLFVSSNNNPSTATDTTTTRRKNSNNEPLPPPCRWLSHALSRVDSDRTLMKPKRSRGMPVSKSFHASLERKFSVDTLSRSYKSQEILLRESQESSSSQSWSKQGNASWGGGYTGDTGGTSGVGGGGGKRKPLLSSGAPNKKGLLVSRRDKLLSSPSDGSSSNGVQKTFLSSSTKALLLNSMKTTPKKSNNSSSRNALTRNYFSSSSNGGGGMERPQSLKGFFL